MNLKQELYDALEGHGVKYIDVSTRAVQIYTDVQREAFVLPLTPETKFDDLVNNIKQYLRNRT